MRRTNIRKIVVGTLALLVTAVFTFGSTEAWAKTTAWDTGHHAGAKTTAWD
jgi:hypothetical protein